MAKNDEERARVIEALQLAITEGVASGTPEPLDFDEFKRRMRARWTSEQAARRD